MDWSVAQQPPFPSLLVPLFLHSQALPSSCGQGPFDRQTNPISKDQKERTRIRKEAIKLRHIVPLSVRTAFKAT